MAMALAIFKETYSVEGKSVNEIAEKVAFKFLDLFGRQRGEPAYLTRAPNKRQEIWELGSAPVP